MILPLFREQCVKSVSGSLKVFTAESADDGRARLPTVLPARLIGLTRITPVRADEPDRQQYALHQLLDMLYDDGSWLLDLIFFSCYMGRMCIATGIESLARINKSLHACWRS